MGLDVYLEARITERVTGRCISISDRAYGAHGSSAAFRTEDCDWVTIFWTFSSSAVPLRNSWIDIVNRYGKTAYSYEDIEMPVPQAALREMCSCLLSYACTPESNRFAWDVGSGFWDASARKPEPVIPYQNEQQYSHIGWDDKESWENTWLFYGQQLRQFIYLLDRIHYENQYGTMRASGDGLCETGGHIFPDAYIENVSDLRRFRENPQAYDWAFRLINSY